MNNNQKYFHHRIQIRRDVEFYITSKNLFHFLAKSKVWSNFLIPGNSPKCIRLHLNHLQKFTKDRILEFHRKNDRKRHFEDPKYSSKYSGQPTLHVCESDDVDENCWRDRDTAEDLKKTKKFPPIFVFVEDQILKCILYGDRNK